MKITSVDAINLSYEYLPDQRFRYGGGICTHRVTTLITISTDSGLTGIGSAYTHPSLAHVIVRDQLEPLLKGLSTKHKVFPKIRNISYMFGMT